MITICTNVELIARYVGHDDHETCMTVARDAVPAITKAALRIADVQVSSWFADWQGGRYSRGGCPLVHWSKPGEASVALEINKAIEQEIALALALEVVGEDAAE